MSIYGPTDPEYLGFIDSNGDGISDLGEVYSPIENKSFALLRTNPRLTSNIKVIVDSNELMYFGAFKANKELAKVEFQKYPIKSSGRFANDIAKFYNNLPTSLRYQIFRKNSDLTIYSDYASQYETQYQYGTTSNSTKLYDEQYRIFAPIWLEKNTPNKFVIYRIEDVDYRADYAEDVSGQNSRIVDLLSKATIIKTYDLTKNTEIGKYIYNHVNDKGFPNAAITFNFQEGEKSTFNGIDINNGGFVSKAEVLDKSYTVIDYPEILSNETITRGFSRNDMVSANIMNLEFLFDDNTASNYKIYRYFGLYVDDIVEGSFHVDNIDSNGLLSVNIDSYKSLYNIKDTSLSAIDMMVNEEDLMMPTLNYVKDKFGSLYHIKNGIKNLRDFKLPISTNGSTIENFRGFSKTGERITAISKDAKTKGFIKLTIVETPANNDRFFIGDKSEIIIEGNNIGSFTFIADTSIPEGQFLGNRFSANGNLQQVAIALSQSIKTKSLIDYNVHVNGASIIIEDFLDGNSRNQTGFGIYNLNLSNFVQINDADKNNIGLDTSITDDWDIYTPIAGSLKNQLLYVSSDEIGTLQIGEWVKTKNLSTFSKIIEINQDPFEENTWRVILDKPTKLSDDNVFDVYEIYKATHGKLSVYDFKDFDFDFYSTRNTNIGDLKDSPDTIVISIGDYNLINGAEDSYETIDVDANAVLLYNVDAQLEFSVGGFIVLSTGELLEIVDTSLADGGTFLEINQNTPLPPATETTINGQTVLTWPTVFYNGGLNVVTRLYDPLTYFTWLTPVLQNDNSNDTNDTVDIYNEYDRLNENSLKETSLTSRIVPSICKFSLKDASNAKNFEYFLNASEAFGPDNMSPNIEIASTRNVEYLNMEHFHFNKIPTYFDGLPEIDLLNYIDFERDGGLTIDKLTSTSFNFFNSSLIWNGLLSNNSWLDNNKKINYTKFSGGSTQSNSSTVFRGLRYVYNKRKEADRSVPTDFINSFDVNGYKFATILDYNKGVEENSVTYKIIKNDIFKFITVFIQLNIVENDIEYLDRYNIYELNDVKSDNNIVNTVIPFQIDIPNSVWDGQNGDAFITASEFSIQAGNADFERYISQTMEGEYSWLLFEAIGNTWGLKVVKIIDKTKIVVSGYPYKWDTDNNTAITGERMQFADFSLVGIGTRFTYFNAGSNEFANLLEKINAYNFAQRFNKFEDIEYITVLKDGSLKHNEFSLSVESGTQFIKPSLVKVSTDPNKPKAFQLSSSSVGDILVDREDGGYITLLRRMNGDYNPVFNTVVSFTDIYTENKIPTITSDERKRLIYNKFHDKGVAFASYKGRELEYGYIKNYFYHKVNDENSKNILKLSQTTDKLPVYPLIGEIAIDKKDINLFKSKYSNDFFNKALPAGESELVHGTLSPIEKENWFVSTVMKVKDTYDVTKYGQTVEESIERLNEIRINNLNVNSIHWTEDDNSIYADFYLPKAISNELREEFIERQFASYVNPVNSFGDKSSINDDLDIYIDNNISTRFIIDQIRVYGLEQKGGITEFTSVTEVNQLTNDRYKELNSYTIQGYQGDALSFRLIYNKRPGYSYKLRVHIKIQA